MDSCLFMNAKAEQNMSSLLGSASIKYDHKQIMVYENRVLSRVRCRGAIYLAHVLSGAWELIVGRTTTVALDRPYTCGVENSASIESWEIMVALHKCPSFCRVGHWDL